jgi:hypothetical protein
MRLTRSLLMAGAFAVVIAAGVVPPGLRASGASLEPGSTGGFGETSCQRGHTGAAADEAPGALTLEGVPVEYEPGTAYRITVVLTRPGVALAGFQIAAREDGFNMRSGFDAGWIGPTDDRARAVHGTEQPVTYVQHTAEGMRAAADGRITWTIDWIAPDGFGVPVVFHAAAVAANGDGSPDGDAVYTATSRSR